MNPLIDGCPGTVEIGGQPVPIRTDFRVWIMLEQLALDSTVQPPQRAPLMLNLCYPTIPQDFDAAMRAILWFYFCGRAEDAKQRAHGGKQQKIYDYDCDAGLIIAAFWHDYQMDLTQANLHWWVYKSLFDGLSADNQFCKVLSYRTMDTSKLKGKSRALYDRLKKQYALPVPHEEREKLDAVAKYLTNTYEGR